jgi:hypothetical protein
VDLIPGSFTSRNAQIIPEIQCSTHLFVFVTKGPECLSQILTSTRVYQKFTNQLATCFHDKFDLIREELLLLFGKHILTISYSPQQDWDTISKFLPEFLYLQLYIATMPERCIHLVVHIGWIWVVVGKKRVHLNNMGWT